MLLLLPLLLPNSGLFPNQVYEYNLPTPPTHHHHLQSRKQMPKLVLLLLLGFIIVQFACLLDENVHEFIIMAC